MDSAAITLLAATITMGIGSGVYLLYASVIMPGLGKTDDRTFVGAFQEIDKAIVGPFLLVIFVGPPVLAAVAAALHLGADRPVALVLIVGALVLELLIVVLTLRINVPLNDGIKAAGDPREIDDLNAVRREFNETRWVTSNNVRSAAALIAFVALAVASAI